MQLMVQAQDNNLSFDLGTLGYSQTTINFDVTTQMDMEGFAGPVSLAMGC
jgi:iron complex outermembrane receptor protein